MRIIIDGGNYDSVGRFATAFGNGLSPEFKLPGRRDVGYNFGLRLENAPQSNYHGYSRPS
jgi:hypothetical protein